MKVFVLEDDPQRRRLFQDACIGHDLTLAVDVAEAIKKWNPPYDFVCLDHDLGGEVYVPSEQENTGAGFCRWLVQQENRSMIPGVFVHSYNLPGAKVMQAILHAAGIDSIYTPFGPTVLNVLKDRERAFVKGENGTCATCGRFEEECSCP